jgi:plastocyanin
MYRVPRYAALVSLCLIAAHAAAVTLTVQVSDLAGKPVADAVVYVETDGAAPLPKLLKAAEIEQRGLKFLPLVTVIQTGSHIAFPNNDKVKHHIYSFSPAKKFDQKLYSGVMAAPQVFDKAGTVVLGCNIHDRMIAYVKVVDTPFFGKTDASGAVRIELPAAGKVSVKVWHYNTAAGAVTEQAVTVKPGEAAPAQSFKLPMKPPVVESEQAPSDPAY